ncbi:hypothetical protein [Sphingomonas oryzagri]
MDLKIGASAILIFASFLSPAIAEAEKNDVVAEQAGPWRSECMSVGHIEAEQAANGKEGDAFKAALHAVADRGGNTLTTDITTLTSEVPDKNWTKASKIVGEGLWCPAISLQPNHVGRRTPITLPALPTIRK